MTYFMFQLCTKSNPDWVMFVFCLPALTQWRDKDEYAYVV